MILLYLTSTYFGVFKGQLATYSYVNGFGNFFISLLANLITAFLIEKTIEFEGACAIITAGKIFLSLPTLWYIFM
jgi:hypothetical protein